MDLQTLQYNKGAWSSQSFPNLDSENTLILIFAAPEFMENPVPIQEMVQHYPRAKIIGCSSAGEIAGAGIHDHSLSVAIMRFKKTPIQLVKAEIQNPEESFSVGKKISEQLNREDLRGIFVLSEGLNVNGSELTKGLNSIFKKEIVITGGLAGDGKDFKKTWLICEGKLCQRSVVAIGFYGDFIQIGHGSRGGWDIFGPEREITRAKNNVLYELDDKPALTLYKEYLGEKAADLPASGLLFPLAIRPRDASVAPVVRTILGVDEKTQSLTFAGDMPVGYFAQLMRANFDRLISSASEASQLATQFSKVEGPLLSVAISCVGRRLVLGERTEEETESTLEVLPKGATQVGFYSYGEISPHAAGPCELHNQTMTLTTFYEKEAP